MLCECTREVTSGTRELFSVDGFRLLLPFPLVWRVFFGGAWWIYTRFESLTGRRACRLAANRVMDLPNG
jgi:hypothetical protein